MTCGYQVDVMDVPPTLEATTRAIVDILLIPIFILTYLIPRSERIAVYGYSNGISFTDNSKYQFIYTSRNEPELRAVWLTRNESVVSELRSAGYEAHRFRSPTGIYLTLRAGIVYVTHTRRDVPWWGTGGADVVRLGHGIPFKKYGRADPGYRDRKGNVKRIGYELTVANYTDTIATSENFAPYVAAATGLGDSSVHVTGLPRMDMPHVDEEARHLYCDRDLIRKLRTDLSGSTVVFYFPTWREGGDSPVPESLDFEALDTTLEETDSYLLTRPHPNSSGWDLDPTALDRVITLDMESDFYPVFEHVDLFITDYSSLFHDSIYYETPAVFFAHDLPSYTDRRDFFFEYESVPGDVVTTSDEFQGRLRAVLEDLEEYERRYEDEIESWRDETFAYDDGGNCERVSRTFSGDSPRTGRDRLQGL